MSDDSRTLSSSSSQTSNQRLRIPQLSVTAVLRLLWRARLHILGFAAFFLCIAVAFVTLSDKQYLVSATVKQTSLSDVIQPQLSGAAGALGLAMGVANQDDRVNSYLSVLASPEIGKKLMSNGAFMSILFGSDIERSHTNPNVWVRNGGIKYYLNEIQCLIRGVECSQAINAEDVSDELASRLTVSPSETITQGVLTSIGNTDTFDLSLRGKNPQQLLEMIKFLHNATNLEIQQDQVALAESIVASLNALTPQIQNSDARAQVIMVLSTEEQKLAILRSGNINYAADWLIRPTLSTWPVKPNASLIYALAILAALIFGPLLQLAAARWVDKLPLRAFRTLPGKDLSVAGEH